MFHAAKLKGKWKQKNDEKGIYQIVYYQEQ